jgi:hypothetical protein
MNEQRSRSQLYRDLVDVLARVARLTFVALSAAAWLAAVIALVALGVVLIVSV